MFISRTDVFKVPLPSRPHEPWAQQSWSGVCRSRWCVFGWFPAAGSPAWTRSLSYCASSSSRMNSWGWNSPLTAEGGRTINCMRDGMSRTHKMDNNKSYSQGPKWTFCNTCQCPKNLTTRTIVLLIMKLQDGWRYNWMNHINTHLWAHILHCQPKLFLFLSEINEKIH